MHFESITGVDSDPNYEEEFWFGFMFWCFEFEFDDLNLKMNLISDTFLLLAHWNIAENFKKVKKQVRTSKL